MSSHSMKLVRCGVGPHLRMPVIYNEINIVEVARSYDVVIESDECLHADKIAMSATWNRSNKREGTADTCATYRSVILAHGSQEAL